MTRISQQQLESYLWGAATLLRGTIDAGDYKQFIFPLLFYKRLCDVFDEETEAALKESGGDAAFAAYPENHRFQIPQDAHWRETRKAAKNVGQVLQSAMRATETANPEKLYGIFGDAQWTNKDRLPDAMLRDLVEHFSTLELTVANLPEDELGQGYEYLIKKFADDSGHTAAEFYTNRTVVHLMTELLDVQPGESVYDPTCGSGGMLLSCIAHLRRQGKEWRNVRLYGQERNLMTSSIARMNCFLHGIEDFRIERGDTLSDPKFIQGDHLQRFDVVLANPPYSIKQWDREAFASDAWGRNLYGTPPQGRADYAFWQHILCSLSPKTGRCAILFPHGVLFRQEEADMRRKLIEADLIECVVGLGSNLFYNSAMGSCVAICRASKPKTRTSKILLIDARNEVTRERAQSFLADDHIERIIRCYRTFKDEPGFAHVVSAGEVLKQDGNLNIPLYIDPKHDGGDRLVEGGERLAQAFKRFCETSSQVRQFMARVAPGLKDPGKLEAAQRALELPKWLRKSEWRTVRLADVAVRDAGRIEPDGKTIHRWIGADHLDEGDLRVKRWSDTNDPLFPPTFRFTFKAGQVLLHSRNLKKVAIPPFNGITGEKLFVLKSKDQTILREDFLAFVLMSARFNTWVNKWLSGSVNKFLNWSALERFEFHLPPLDQQRRLADILWAINDTLISNEATAEATQALSQAELNDFLYNRRNWPVADCGTLLADGPKNGFSPPSTSCPRGLPTLSISAIREGQVIPEGSLKYADVTEEHVAQFLLNPRDILIVRGNGNRTLCGRAGLVAATPPGCFYPDLLIRVRFREDALLPEFAVLQWNEPRAYTRLLAKAKSTNGIWKINGKDIQSHTLVVPPIAEQRQFLQAHDSTCITGTAVNRVRQSTTELQTAFVNAIFA